MFPLNSGTIMPSSIGIRFSCLYLFSFLFGLISKRLRKKSARQRSARWCAHEILQALCRLDGSGSWTGFHLHQASKWMRPLHRKAHSPVHRGFSDTMKPRKNHRLLCILRKPCNHHGTGNRCIAFLF